MSDYYNNQDPTQSLIPYLSVYGLDEAPFVAQIEERFFYESHQLSQQLNLILHLLQSTKLLIAILGNQGMGKSMLLHKLELNIPGNINCHTIHAENTLDVDSILKSIARHFGLPPDCGKVALLHLLDEEAYKLHQKDDIPVVIIDEAQLLSPEAIGLLLQLARGCGEHRVPWHFILFAEAGLRDAFLQCNIVIDSDPRLHVSELSTLTEEQTADYLMQRMSAAGLIGAIPFSNAQIKQIHANSRGIPAEINNHAHQMLMEISTDERTPRAEKQKRHTIDDKLPIAQEPVQQAPVQKEPPVLTSVEVQHTVSAAPENIKRKGPWPSVMLSMLAASILLSVIIFQDDINALFSSPDKLPKTAAIETLTIPDQKEMVEAIPSLLQPREQSPQPLPVPFPAQSTIQSIPAVDMGDADMQENEGEMAEGDIRPALIEVAPDATITQAATVATTQRSVAADQIDHTELAKQLSAPIEQGKADADTAGSIATPAAPQESVTTDTPTTTEPRASAISEEEATPSLKSDKIHDAVWLLKQKGSAYTLQLLASQELQNTEKFLTQNRLEHGNSAVYKAQRKQHALYILLYGIYPDKASAQQAVTRLPASIRKLKPWIRPVSAIQQDIRGNGH